MRYLCGILLLLVHASLLRAEPLLDRLLIVAPAAPGGGWDQTARAMQHALEREGLVRVVEVHNVAGAAGTIGLAQFVDTQRGNGTALLVTGLVMLGATIWNDSPVSLGRVTPIARLTGEYEVVAVPAASPHRTMSSLVDALRASPAQVSWGGGSAGGTDHILAGLIAAAARVDPRRVNYIAFSGGGEAVAALVGGNVTAGVSGYSEFAPHIESGRLRALAISASSRVPGIDAPTLREQGFDVELSNWRGVVAPPDLSPEARRQLADVISAMARSGTWRKTLVDRGWTDIYEDDAAFERYLESEHVRTARIVTRLRGPAGSAPAGVGQRIYPVMVFSGAAIVAVLLMWRRARSTSLEAHPQGRSSVRAVALTGAGLLAFLVLLEPLGFVIAASVMFAVAAGLGLRAFGIGLLFSAAVYVAFTRGLDLALPAGAAWPWIR